MNNVVLIISSHVHTSSSAPGNLHYPAIFPRTTLGPREAELLVHRLFPMWLCYMLVFGFNGGKRRRHPALCAKPCRAITIKLVHIYNSVYLVLE